MANSSSGRPEHIIFMGASVMDLITYTNHFPQPGETLTGNSFAKGTGGKAANACVMAAKMEAKTRILARIGDDDFGHEMIANFKRQGVSTDFLIVDKERATATAAITVNKSGENMIAYVPGATNFLSADNIVSFQNELFADCALFMSTFECDPATLLQALRIARQKNVKTLINGAPPFPQTMEQTAVFALCDVFCVNIHEAALITRLNLNVGSGPEIAAKYLVNTLGCRQVIITLGAEGAMLYDGKSAKKISVDPEQACKINVVDTTGAGDSFMGALAYFMVHAPHLPMEEIIQRCNVVAADSVSKHGTQSSYARRAELPAHLFR